MSDNNPTMNFDEAQAFAKRFADHAYAELAWDGWNVIIPTGAEDINQLPDEFKDTPAWEAHSQITGGSQTVLEEWARNSSECNLSDSLLVIARAYNLEQDFRNRYREIFADKAELAGLPQGHDELMKLNTITYLDYKTKRDELTFAAMNEVEAEFAERKRLFEESIAVNNPSNYVG
jgi:hypothetical protein